MYILCVAVAPYLSIRPIWYMADITNALMAFPNLVALLVLSPIVIAETKKYFNDADVPEIKLEAKKAG